VGAEMSDGAGCVRALDGLRRWAEHRCDVIGALTRSA